MNADKAAPKNAGTNDARILMEDPDLLGPAIPEKVSKNVNVLHQEQLGFGERAADVLAKQAGSWRFIMGFMAVLVIWMALNSVAFIKGWDPYPFILLNLVLSCLAAIQAPVIMMSQNRQEDRDRLEADADYHINVKAEAELERLHRKIDHLHAKLERVYSRSVEQLLKLQEEQMSILGSLSKETPESSGK